MRTVVGKTPMSWDDFFGWTGLWVFMMMPITMALLATTSRIPILYPFIPWIWGAIFLEFGTWISSLFGQWAVKGFPM